MQLSEYSHATGAHCGSASLRNLAAYYGWGFDEPFCFGIGAGLGFGYYDHGPASRLIMGRNGQLETGFFETLGVEYRETSEQDWETAWDDVQAHIEDGEPVMLFADIFYLDYFDTNTHFGPHTLLCVGFEGDDVFLSDTEFESVQRLPKTALREAWDSDYGFGPLDNQWLVVRDPDIERDIETASTHAIERATEQLLEPESGRWKTQGIDAIRRFADDLPTWTQLDDTSWCARFAYQNIERRGTGGGAFRRLYADFLEQVASELGLEADFPTHLHDIADEWTRLSETLKKASECEGRKQERLLEEAGTQAMALADDEEQFFTRLRESI
ncbi:BtrH N-terminal domain-containing protein [Haladaptatus sp. NG-SE-30]